MAIKTQETKDLFKGVTKQGFHYEIEKKRLENYELVEYLSEVETNPMLMPKVVTLLLGEDQKNNLKDFLRDKDGLIDSEKLGEVITDIFESREQLKK